MICYFFNYVYVPKIFQLVLTKVESQSSFYETSSKIIVKFLDCHLYVFY